MFSFEIKRAYLYANAIRLVYIETPLDDRQKGDEGMIWKLNFSFYGARGVAQNLQKEYIGFMGDMCFQVGKVSLGNFYRPKMDTTCIVHRDDFTPCGPEVAIEWRKAKFEAKYAANATYSVRHTNLRRHAGC